MQDLALSLFTKKFSENITEKYAKNFGRRKLIQYSLDACFFDLILSFRDCSTKPRSFPKLSFQVHHSPVVFPPKKNT